MNNAIIGLIGGCLIGVFILGIIYTINNFKNKRKDAVFYDLLEWDCNRITCTLIEGLEAGGSEITESQKDFINERCTKIYFAGIKRGKEKRREKPLSVDMIPNPSLSPDY